MDTRHPLASGLRTALVALALATVVLAPSVARAADPDVPSETADGWRKVLAYSRCAFQVFRALTPTDWTSALLDCGRTFLAESPAPSADGGAR